jgi:hypothetical protein
VRISSESFSPVEVILTIARSKDFSIEKLKAAMAKSAEIH